MDDIKINPTSSVPNEPQKIDLASVADSSQPAAEPTHELPAQGVELKPVETFSLGGGATDTPNGLLEPTVPDASVPETPLATPAETTPSPIETPILIESSQNPSPVEAVNVPAASPTISEQPAVAGTEQPPQLEPLPPPSAELAEAVTGIPQPTPEEKAGMSKKTKIGLIVGGVFVVAAATGALLYFGQGGPFKGQVAAPSDVTKYSAVELCPTDYYAPKTSAYLPDRSLDLSVAKAQLLPFTPEGIKAVDTAKDTVNLINKNNAEALSVVGGANADLTGTAQPGISSETATLETSEQPGISSETATLGEESALPLTIQTSNLNDVLPVGSDVTVPEGCYPIPHDHLAQGNDQCGLIEQLYLDPSGYRLNDETKKNLEGWHMKCSPPPVEVNTLCGENQETGPIGTAPTCICKQGYFDVSFALPEGASAVTTNPFVGTAAPVDTIQQTSALVCWNCEKLLTGIDNYKKQLEAATTVDEKTILEERIKNLEDIAKRNDCEKPVVTQEICGENEYRDASGTCVCDDHFKKSATANICVYNCEIVISKILDMRKSATISADTQLMADLAAIEKEAVANKCVVPKEKTACEQYLDDSNNAFNDGNYDLYYENSKKYIDADCSGKTPTDCEKILDEGVSINRVIRSTAGAAPPIKYNDVLTKLKGEYYANSTCNKTETRCSELAAEYGGSQASAAPTNLRTDQISPTHLDTVNLKDLNITDAITPGTVFNDDREYYDKYCKTKELSCDEVRSSLTLDKIRTLDVTADIRSKYELCLVVPTINTSPSASTSTSTPTPTSTSTPTPTSTSTPTPTSTSTPASTSTPTSTPTPTPAPAASIPPVVNTVETETASIDTTKVSAPVSPATPSADEQEQTIPPVVETAHPAAPETAVVPTPTYEEVPPAITPTGPESYIYLVGFVVAQIYFFRRKIYALFVSMI
jgi:hypothetical protein